ncbi:MAG: diguanylate cyclase [Myxococcales bacterium]|nr:diguanylate cyclase [Myxococcales bacterium]
MNTAAANQDRILVVEDDESARQAMSMLLEFEGFEVRSAVGGIAALEIVQTWIPDLVVSDIQMPGGDGFELVAALLKVDGCRDAPILLVSARDGIDRRINGLDLGADDFMSKPVQPEELLARIRAHLRSSHRRKDLEHTCTIDEQTKLLNRRGINEALDEEVERAKLGNLLSVLVLDLDNFKVINDTHGHLVGDQVLRAVAQGIKSIRRSVDRAGRWGGDEFVIVLSNCCALQTPGTISRFRDSIERDFVTDTGISIPIACSIGAASYEPDLSSQDLLAAADKAMYEDKTARRTAI